MDDTPTAGSSTQSLPNQSVPASSPIVSTDVVLIAIQEEVNKITTKSVPITRDTRMDRYFIEVSGEHDLDLLELSFRLDAKFGVRITNEDWSYLSGGTPTMSKEEWEAKYAEFFTFGRLADLVASRARIGPVKSVSIAGSSSASAGAFRAIEEMAKQIRPHIEPFAPSTRIADRFTDDDLTKVWGRIRVLSGNRAPPLESAAAKKLVDSIFHGLRGAFICLVLYGLLVWMCYRLIMKVPYINPVAPWIAGLSPVFLLYFLNRSFWFVSRKLGHSMYLLPNNLETFRDLAELISGDRGGWCTKCDYNLTGLTFGICPECGTPINPNPLQWVKSEPKS